MNDRAWVLLCCIPYATVTARVFYNLGARRLEAGVVSWLGMLIGFALHTAFLYFRGEAIGHCPLTNLFETCIFLSWSIVLNYLLLGPLFRVSPLGTFTAPLALFINLFALAIPSIDLPHTMRPMGWMLEAHAALSLLAYGTLGLATVAAAMVILFNHFLKTRRLPPLIFRLPPLGILEIAHSRTLFLGFLLLTIGIGFGFLAYTSQTYDIDNDYVKIIWSLMVWAAYTAILILKLRAKLSPIRFAWATVVIYSFVLLTFFGINSLSELHRFHL